MKEFRIPALFFMVAVLVIFIADRITPPPVDWTVTLDRGDTIPYGTWILYDLKDVLFPGRTVAPVMAPPAEVLDGGKGDGADYLAIAVEFSPNPDDTASLLDAVDRGCNLFIAAEVMGGTFAETLGVGTQPSYPLFPATIRPERFMRGAGDLALEKVRNFYFSGVPEGARIFCRDSEGRPNLIRIKRGAGSIVLCSIPLAFTNQAMVNGRDYDFACRALSLLPVRNLLWDEYYKPARQQAGTPLRFILSRAPLRWAYWTALAGVLLFIIFRARRLQRPLPSAREGDSGRGDFVRTVAGLYFEEANHRHMAGMMIRQFREWLRVVWHIDGSGDDAGYRNLLAQRTGLDIREVDGLFDRIRDVEKSKTIGPGELVDLSRRIEKFHGLTRGITP